MEENLQIKYNKSYFLIAELLAFLAFVFNSVCVIMADRGGPFVAAWMPKFDLFYWLKTIFAVSGLVYYSISRALTSKEVPSHISLITLIILLYSIPFINSLFLIPFAVVLKLFRGTTFYFDDRIAIQGVWSILVLILVLDFFIRLMKIQNNEKN